MADPMTADAPVDEAAANSDLVAPAPRGPRRTRYRRDSLKVDAAAIVARVCRFFDEDVASRTDETERRLQRKAKERGWTEGKTWPWDDSSDIALPDMMIQSQRMQDTLANAAMQVRPLIGSKAIVNPADKDKEPVVDRLLDFQFFVEAGGEQLIGDIVADFVTEPAATVFTPWVTETRETVDIESFDDIPDDGEPEGWFRATLAGKFPGYIAQPTGDGWDWKMTPAKPGTDAQPFKACFYTKAGGGTELVVRRDTTVFDGPRPMRLSWDEVLHGPRVANLQPPGPSNPGGAPHVLIAKPCGVDEIRRLAKSGFYDLATKEQLEALPNVYVAPQNDETEQQKDTLQGVTQQPGRDKETESHGELTRLICFDCYDLDGDGVDEDVIFWVLLEPKVLLKAKALTEMYPASPPRRPFARSSFIPVPGRSAGISLLEMIEGLHDVSKIAYDQMVDSGTLATAPWGLYKASSGLRNEVIRMAPGELYPTANPQTDVFIPQFNNNAAAFGINLLTLLEQWEQKVTLQGDLQLGRVPTGKASALRTAAATSMIANQGEARPERVLRRWFMILAEVFAQMHELNQRFLSPNKKFLIGTPRAPSEDPYQEVTSRSAIEGRFQFTFTANVLNTSKGALQQSLSTIGALMFSPIAIQLGIVGPKEAYNYATDVAKSEGQDPQRYFREPEPGYGKPPIFAAEAMLLITRSEMPDGRPESHQGPGGAAGHLAELIAYVGSDQFGHLSPSQIDLFKVWVAHVRDAVQVERQRQQLVEAAQLHQQGQQSQGAPGPGRPAGPQPNPNPGTMISGPGELLDETMPSGGGGAHTGAPA